MDFEQWKAELLFTGDIVQDEDGSVSKDERGRRFVRYVALVNAVDGSEGEEAYAAIVESMRAESDYGAYQSTFRALSRFPADVAGRGLARSLAILIARNPEWAGDLLCGLSEQHVAGLNLALSRTSREARDSIMAFVLREEDGGWLEDRAGEIRPE